MNERIKAVRKALKMTQAEFGSRIGVKANTITNYETGTRAPGNAVIISICREFRVNRVWLETGVGEMFEAVSEPEAISERIKAVRKTLKLTQVEFSVELKTSRSNLASIETGTVNPTPMFIELICNKFNVSAVWLETGEGEMFETISEPDAMIERIKTLRNVLKLTQAEFGSVLGTSRDAISNIEQGRVKPSSMICKLLCREFNVNPVWLETGAGEMFETASEVETINERIKKVRLAMGLSQDDFAERLGLSRGVIVNIELRRSALKPRLLSLICQTYNVNTVWLETGIGDMFEVSGVCETISNRIKKVRLASGLTQNDFAERLGFSRSVITNIEYDRVAPASWLCKLICYEFNVNLTWLETGAGEMFKTASVEQVSDIENQLVRVLSKLDKSEWALLASIAVKMLAEDQGGKE